MDILWLLLGFFVFCIVVFLAVAVFLPEWVGISGKVAQQNRDSHAGQDPPPSKIDHFLEGKK